MRKQTEDAFREWIETVEAKTSASGQTSEEISADLGKCDKVVRRLLREAARQGRLEVGRRYIADLSGRQIPVPVYRFKKGKG